MDDPLAGREIIVEMNQIGSYVRVSAMDTASLTEATISGPSGSPEYVLRANALRKLAFLLNKKGIIDLPRVGKSDDAQDTGHWV